MAGDVREESVNNLACFFVVRTAMAEGLSQSPLCLAWKVLSLEIEAHNLMGNAAPEQSTHQMPGNAYYQGHPRYNVMENGGLTGLYFPETACHFCLLSPNAMCLKFAVMLGIAMRNKYPTPLCLCNQNVSECIQRDVSGVSVLSPTPEKSPLKERKGMPVFSVKTLVLWLVGRRNGKIQRRSKMGGKSKGTNIAVWGPVRTHHQTICGQDPEAAFNDSS